MKTEDILRKVDHTQLGVAAGWEDIRLLIDDAIFYQTASVCIPPRFVAEASAYAQGRMPVCTVIGFPNGYSTAETKVFEARDAIAKGAAEIDMVIPVGALKSGRTDEVSREIAELRKACGEKILKVIIETCLLTEEEKIAMCRIVTDEGADFIKTSTGFSTGGATFDDVKLFAENIGPAVRIKAAGGISSFADAEKFIELGASRLGTSRLVRIMKEEAR